MYLRGATKTQVTRDSTYNHVQVFHINGVHLFKIRYLVKLHVYVGYLPTHIKVTLEAI